MIRRRALAPTVTPWEKFDDGLATVGGLKNFGILLSLYFASLPWMACFVRAMISGGEA
jgi:hypothetical protein